MRAGVLLILLLPGFAPAPLPKRERPCGDLTDVAGLWQIVHFERGGELAEDLPPEYHVELTRETFRLGVPDGGGSDFVMKLNPAVSPPAFSLWQNKQVSHCGSYRLQNDRLTMIFAGGTRIEDRPRDFAGKPSWRYVFRRVGR
jgi:uncharacterized protein (TIGR03067 family)